MKGWTFQKLSAKVRGIGTFKSPEKKQLLFAVSDVVWQALIGAIVTIILAYMQRRTSQAVGEVTSKLKEASIEVKEVKKDLATATLAADVRRDIANDKIDQVSQAVEQVHRATNSMKDELVASVKEAATLAGHAEGVAAQKADAAAVDKTDRSVDRLP